MCGKSGKMGVEKWGKIGKILENREKSGPK